jgi:hypothetical protein
MGVLVVASFSISRILYLLDVYYTGCEVGCQVNFNHRFRGFRRFCGLSCPLRGQRKQKREEQKGIRAQEHRGEGISRPEGGNGGGDFLSRRFR